MQRGSRIGLTIIGESDCVGTSSDKYSWQRAEKIKQKLEGENLEKLVISTKVKTCNNYKNNENNSLLNVSFKVKQI